MLTRIKSLLDANGARALNVDAMVIAEAPKLAPHRAEMCANIARSLGVDSSCVSVKATTNETLGAIGRREGLAAMAVAMVERS
jgi:2-C-methyl-D-erythritol 2,4-cyclodiphosphate synthase